MDIMKKLIYIFLLFLSINILSSDWEFGVKAGLNYNHFEVNRFYRDEEGTKNSFDFLLGGVGRKQINDWIFFSLEVIYNRKNLIISLEDNMEETNRIYYLDIPILLNLIFYGLEFQIGGYISKYITSYRYLKGNSGTEYTEWGHLNNELNSWDFGYILGFGYRFKSFLIEVRYSRSIRDQNSENYPLYYVDRIDYFDQWSFNIGYFF